MYPATEQATGCYMHFSVLALSQKLVLEMAHVRDKLIDTELAWKSCCILEDRRWRQDLIVKVDWIDNFDFAWIPKKMPNVRHSSHRRIFSIRLIKLVETAWPAWEAAQIVEATKRRKLVDDRNKERPNKRMWRRLDFRSDWIGVTTAESGSEKRMHRRLTREKCSTWAEERVSKIIRNATNGMAL